MFLQRLQPNSHFEANSFIFFFWGYAKSKRFWVRKRYIISCFSFFIIRPFFFIFFFSLFLLLAFRLKLKRPGVNISKPSVKRFFLQF